MGIEPMTAGLQDQRSATELQRLSYIPQLFHCDGRYGSM